MTNNKLSAKVAELRGENKLIQTAYEGRDNGLYFLPCEELEQHQRWKEPDGTETFFSDAYRQVLPYSTDLNLAWELLKELPNEMMHPTAVGYLDEKESYCAYWEYGKRKVWTGSTPARAICKAYIAWKGVPNG